ncbi:MAG: peptide chain release factor N(5)-glutamine methyltransferase [Desulfobacteraceae bacterium]|nr:MAG: peptide chain release factor N(5)-glutamine methyltransferase [Desulfobacteraceae bacterium]
MQNRKNSPGTKWTLLSLLKWTTDYFKSHGIENPRTDAEVLLAEALGLRRIDLYIRYDQPLTDDELSRFKAMIKRRIRREPVAYITGAKEFWSMDLRVTGDVLIPRPETELLVEAALDIIPNEAAAFRVFEIGTGSGAISLAIARERPAWQLFASDICVKAVTVARENAERNGLKERIQFFVGNGCKPLKEDLYSYDMIVSNPPYIKTDDLPGLQPEIYLYEPRKALEGGMDGLDTVRQIVGSAHRHLNRGGHLILEIGSDQRAGVQQIIESAGRYGSIAFFKDYSGHDRMVHARRS